MKHWATWLNSREKEKKTLHLCTIEQPLLTDGETVAVFFNSLSFLAHIHFII